MNYDEFSKIMEHYKKRYDLYSKSFCIFVIRDKIKNISLTIILYGLRKYINDYHNYQKSDTFKVDDFISWCQNRNMKCYVSDLKQNLKTIIEVKKINNKFKQANIFMPEYHYLFWEFAHTYDKYTELTEDDMIEYVNVIGKYLDEINA